MAAPAFQHWQPELPEHWQHLYGQQDPGQQALHLEANGLSFIMHTCLCIKNLQPAFVYVTLSCCTTDISAPKSDNNHPAEIALVGNTISACSVSVAKIDLTCLYL